MLRKIPRTLSGIVILVCFICLQLRYDSKQNQPIECIDTYLNCDSIYNLDSTYSNYRSNLLFAKWQIRKGENDIALLVLDSLQILTEQNKDTKLYQDIMFYKFLALQSDYELTLEELEDELDLDLSPVHNVNLLLLKSRLLRSQEEVDYSFACSLYAEQLRHQLSSENQDEVYFLPWAIHSVNLIRENVDTIISKHYLKKTLSNCENNSPGCRWIRTLLLTLSESLSELQIRRIKKKVSPGNQYSPSTDERINVHLNSLTTDNHYAIKNFLIDIDTSVSLGEELNFYNTTYLIDAYLETGNLAEAEIWINKLLELKFPKEFLKRYVIFREQKLFHQQYLNSKDRSKLMELMSCSTELISGYDKDGTKILNEHYADAIYLANNIFLETLYILNDINGINQSNLLNHLSSIKRLYNKVSDSRSVLGNRQPDDQTLQKINHLKHQIEIKELEVERYRGVDYSDLSVFEDLYLLHEELYNLKINLPESENLINQQGGTQLALSSINDSTQIIDYIQTDSSIFVSRITHDNIDLQKLDMRRILVAISDKKSTLLKKTEELELNYLDSVFMKIILEDYPKVIFVPDGDLFDFPIEVLKDKLGNVLLHNHNISYASQISEAINKSLTKDNPSFFACSYSNEATKNDSRIRTYPELTYGQSEVEAISKFYNISELYSGYKLTEENIFNATNNDIVHISSHSSSSTDNPLANYILVRDGDGQGRPIYGFTLKTKEWDSDLVILSSCESGTGAIKPGAGIFSLSRDFLQAGTKSVVKSLWKVNEKSTSDLMVLFHKNLSSGKSVSQALRFAKLELQSIDEYSHPYYWAGFVLEGKPDLIFSNTSSSEENF